MIISVIYVWAVMVVGPNFTVPLHHYKPVVWTTQEKCEDEIERVTSDPATIMDPAFHLECVAVPDLRGVPA